MTVVCPRSHGVGDGAPVLCPSFQGAGGGGHVLLQLLRAFCFLPCGAVGLIRPQALPSVYVQGPVWYSFLSRPQVLGTQSQQMGWPCLVGWEGRQVYLGSH